MKKFSYYKTEAEVTAHISALYSALDIIEKELQHEPIALDRITDKINKDIYRLGVIQKRFMAKRGVNTGTLLHAFGRF